MPGKNQWHVCLEEGCSTLTKQTRCEEHQRSRWSSDRKKYRRNKYSKRWAKISRAYLLGNPRCECADFYCKCNGKCTELSTEVDHIIAVVHFQEPENADHESNLMALCGTCHKSKTMRYDYPGRSGNL